MNTRKGIARIIRSVTVDRLLALFYIISRMMNFKNWLIKQHYIKPEVMGFCGGEPINDLALDVSTDVIFPETKDLKKVKSYLIRCQACEGALDAFNEAAVYYTEYKAAMRWVETQDQP